MRNQNSSSGIIAGTNPGYYLSLLLSNTEDILILLDTDLRITLFNKAAFDHVSKWSGISLETGIHFYDLGSLYARAHRERLHEKVLGGEIEGFEEKIGLPGQESFFYTCMRPATNDTGSVQGIIVTTADITACKHTGRALMEMEERWRYAIEGGKQGVWDWNLSTNECYFSPSYKKLYGFAEGELGNSVDEWRSRCHPDDQALIDNAIGQHTGSGHPYFESVYRIRGKNDEYRWVLGRGMIISRDSSGKPLRMIGTHTDITESKNADETYKTLFYHHPLPMWTYDPQNFRIVEANEAALSLYGYTRSEFLSLSIKELHLAEELKDLERTLAEVSVTGTHKKAGIRHRKKNGEYFYVEVAGTPALFNGRQCRFVTVTDITAKVQAEQRLRDSTNQYRLLFRNNPLPAYIYDMDTLEILEVNNAAVHHYGYSFAEFQSMSLTALHPPERLPRMQEIIRENRHTAQVYVEKWEQVKKNGERILVDIHASLLPYNGREARLVLIQDVTEKVKAEDELRRSNERFSYVSRASSEALWEWDARTNEIFISDAYTDILGWDVDPKRQFMEWHRYIHPDDRDEVLSCYYSCLEDPAKEKWRQQYRYVKSDGSYATVIDKAFIQRDEKGKTIKVTGAIQDISDQKAVEQELRESNLRFTLASKASSDVLYDWEVSSNELYWSEGLQILLGYKPSEMTIDVWKTLIHPEESKRVQESLECTLHHTRKRYWKEQYRFRNANGTYRYILEKGFIVRDKQGKALRMIGAMQDITGLKLKEKELIKSNERYKFATLATSDIIWDWNLQNNLIVWSDNLTKILGWDLPADKTLPVAFEKLHPEDRQRVVESLNAFIGDKHKIHWQEEFRYLRSNGSYAFVSDKAYIIRNEQGQALRLIGAMQDISERSYHQQLLSLERSIFEIAADSAMPFARVMHILLEGVEKIHPGSYTSVMILKDDLSLEPLAAPRLPAGFREAMEGPGLDPSNCFGGAAMYRKQTVIIPDMEKDQPEGRLKELALEHGLQASWALPVLHSSGRVLGSFTIYHKAPKSPTQVEMSSFDRIRNIIRILIENHNSLQELKTANERFDTVMKATHDLIWDWNLESNLIYRDPIGLKKVYGVNDNQDIENITQWMNRIHPEDMERVQAVISDILQSSEQDLFDVEYRFLRDDGSYSYVYDRGKMLRDGGGRPLRMIGAAQDITERKKLEQIVIENKLESQKAINQATVDTQEQERSEIGKELHDNVNQVLTTTKLYLDLALSNPELKDDLIRKSNCNIINVINEIRQLSRSLMDPSIGDLGLVDSIHDLIDNINLTRKLHVALDVDDALEACMSKSQKLTIFRIIQEALNNAIRHANATSVMILISGDDNHITMSVTDDGVGFNVDKVKKGAGLKNIQNRVYLIDGTYTIQSAPGEGCRIQIRFPISKHNQSL
jgi:PAS domain S-box-containing protein